jgi:hypothetical protein
VGGTSEPVLSYDGFGGWEDLEPTGRWGGRSESPCTVDMGHTQRWHNHLGMGKGEDAKLPQVGGGGTSEPVRSYDGLGGCRKPTGRWGGNL